MDLPRTADIVIIGGGVMGASFAWEFRPNGWVEKKSEDFYR